MSNDLMLEMQQKILKLVAAKLAASGRPPSGYYSVDGLRYKLDCPTTGKWAGWLFLKTGSDYHDRKRIALGSPDGKLAATDRGKTVLAAIIADPIECMKAYGDITGQCGVCGRKLEDPTSVSLGIGPVCLGRLMVLPEAPEIDWRPKDFLPEDYHA